MPTLSLEDVLGSRAPKQQDEGEAEKLPASNSKKLPKDVPMPLVGPVGETAMHLITGGFSPMWGLLSGISGQLPGRSVDEDYKKITEATTYQPQSEAGKRYAEPFQKALKAYEDYVSKNFIKSREQERLKTGVEGVYNSADPTITAGISTPVNPTERAIYEAEGRTNAQLGLAMPLGKGGLVAEQRFVTDGLNARKTATKAKGMENVQKFAERPAEPIAETPTPEYKGTIDIPLEDVIGPQMDREARMNKAIQELNQRHQAQTDLVGEVNDAMSLRQQETGVKDMFDPRIEAEPPQPSAREGAVDLGQGPVKAGGASEMSNLPSDLFHYPDQMIGEGPGRGRESMRDRALADVAEKTPRLEKRFNRKKHVPMDEEVGRPTDVPDAPYTEMSTSDLIRQRRVQQADDIRAAEGRQMAEEGTISFTPSFRGPGGRQRGMIDPGAFKSIGEAFADSAEKGASELFRQTRGSDQFEKELVKHLGEESRPYAKSLYTWAQQRHQTTPRAAQKAQGAAQNSQAPTNTQKSAAGTALDRMNRWDKRSGEEFLSDMHQKIDEGRAGDDAPLNPFAQGQKHARRSDITQWVYDRLDWNERTNINLKTQEILNGWAFAGKQLIPGFTGRGSRRVSDPNSAMYHYDQLGSKDQKSLIEAINSANFQNLTQAQKVALQSLQDGFDKAWNRVGMQGPAPKMPTDLWNGNYRVWGESKTVPGKVFVRTVDSLLEAARAKNAMMDKYPDFRWETQDISHGNAPSTAHDFPKLLEVMNKTDAAMANAMDAAAYKGKPRDADPKSFARAAESYVKQLISHAENKKVLDDINLVLKDEKLQEHYKVAIGAARNQVDAYFGRDKFADAWIKDRMEDWGLSRNLPKGVAHFASSALMFLSVMAARVPFYVAQFLQPLLLIPKMMEQQGLGVKASSFKAGVQGLWDFFSGGEKDAMQWAVKHGIADPQFSEAILRSSHQSIVRQVGQWISGNKLSAVIDEMTRSYSFLAMNRFFKNAGMSPEAAREAAAKTSLDVMVEYEGWKRSPFFREMGVVGNFMSPLTTFTNNLFNHIQEYATDATHVPFKKDGKAGVKPIATLMGVMLALSGINGMPGRAEGDWIVKQLNSMADLHLPGPTDLMIKASERMRKSGQSKFVHDAVIFGIPSALTGFNLSGSLGSPDISSSLLPGVGDPLTQLAIKTGTESVPTGLKLMTGQNVSNHDKMNAIKPIVPAAPGQGIMEQEFSVSNKNRGPFQSLLPKDRMLVPGNSDVNQFRRNKTEQWAKYGGMKSTDEALNDMKVYRHNNEKALEVTRRSDALNIITDKMIFPEKNSSKVIRQELQRFIKNGGNMNEYAETVLKKIQNRYKTHNEVELEKAVNSDNPNGLKLMREFGLLKGDRGGGFKKMSNVQSDNLNDSDRQLSLDDFMKTYPKDGTEDERVRFFNKLKQRLEEDRKGSGNIKRYDFRNVDTNDRMPEPSTLDSFERRRSVRKTT